MEIIIGIQVQSSKKAAFQFVEIYRFNTKMMLKGFHYSAVTGSVKFTLVSSCCKHDAAVAFRRLG